MKVVRRCYSLFRREQRQKIGRSGKKKIYFAPSLYASTPSLVFFLLASLYAIYIPVISAPEPGLGISAQMVLLQCLWLEVY